MSGATRSVLLVADKPGVHDDGWSLVAYLDRLETLGFDAQVLCVEASGEAASDERVVGCPGLANRWRLPLAVRNLRLGDRLDRPDLVHVLHGRMCDAGVAIAESWNLPYVLTVDEFLPPDGRLRVSRRWCRRIIAASRDLVEELCSQLRVPAERVVEINPGLDAPETERPVRSGRKVAVIGTAGPLVAGSGLAIFLGAARRVIDAGRDAEFVIAGRGEDEVDLRRRAERLRIADRVTFAGIPVVGLRFWSVLDLFCQPSLVPTVGRSLATALAFGVPSVASDIQGLRALVEHDRTGLRVPPGDTAALAAAIETLLADPERALTLGRTGRELILREFHPVEEARHLVDVYNGAIDSPLATPWTPAVEPIAVA